MNRKLELSPLARTAMPNNNNYGANNGASTHFIGSQRSHLENKEVLLSKGVTNLLHSANELQKPGQESSSSRTTIIPKLANNEAFLNHALAGH